jgi:hypothetical protein
VQATNFSLKINVTTARALGIKCRQRFSPADEVIE